MKTMLSSPNPRPKIREMKSLVVLQGQERYHWQTRTVNFSATESRHWTQKPTRLRNLFPYFCRREDQAAEVKLSIRIPEEPQIRTSVVWEKQHTTIRWLGSWLQDWHLASIYPGFQNRGFLCLLSTMGVQQETLTVSKRRAVFGSPGETGHLKPTG